MYSISDRTDRSVEKAFEGIAKWPRTGASLRFEPMLGSEGILR
jgi:hypothetical protein